MTYIIFGASRNRSKCSYLVLHSRTIFWGLTSFPNPALVFECFWNVKALQEVPTSLSGCSYHPCFAILIFGVLDKLAVCLKTALTSPNASHTHMAPEPKWCANTIMHWHALTVSDRNSVRNINLLRGINPRRNLYLAPRNGHQTSLFFLPENLEYPTILASFGLTDKNSPCWRRISQWPISR